MTGGAGRDRVRGDSGDDHLVGGTIASEAAAEAALDAMMADLGTNTLPADPSGNFVTAADGITDGVTDDLTGNSGADSFFLDTDAIRDFQSGETLY